MAADKATLSVLSTFADLLDSSDGSVSPAVMAFFPTVVEVCQAATPAISDDIVEVMEMMGRLPACHAIMHSEGARELLENIAAKSSSRTLGARISSVIAAMDGKVAAPPAAAPALIPSKGPASGKPSAAVAPPPSRSVPAPVSGVRRRELQTIQLNMDNLLGSRDQEDEYIRALLMLDGVTSVTLDRKREVAIVFTYDAGIKTKLYETVQATCDAIQDDAGKPRFVVRGEHAAYLEDEEAEDFFANGAKHTLARPGGARVGAVETVEERMRRRDAAEAAKSAGWLSWLKW